MNVINIYAPATVGNATLVAWHNKSGDAVHANEAIATIEEEKVIYEVSIPVDGFLVEILAQVGSSVTANQILATYQEKNIKTIIINKLKNFIKITW